MGDQKKTSWQVIRKLGGGGMGDVFLARTPEGEEVAVKILAESQRYNLPFFEQEARLLTKLRHPAIASVLGYLIKSEEIFGEEKGPCFWMEYVEGEDLLTSYKKNYSFDPSPLAGEGGSAPTDKLKSGAETGEGVILNWFQQALEALQYLHGQSILHGDLSPRNILVNKSGHLKLLDFGLASSFLGSASLEAGTLPYLAPERIYGKNLPASDLFSLGTLFYEALAGRHPRASCRSLQELIRTDAPPLCEVVPSLNENENFRTLGRVIDRMIKIERNERFAEVREALEALAGGGFSETLENHDYYPARMYGAEDSLGKMTEALTALSQRSSLFCVHGTTGVGKKRFLREAEFQCALMGVKTRRIPPALLKKNISSLLSAPPDAPLALFFPHLEQLPASEMASLLTLKRFELPPKNLLLIFEWNEDELNQEKRRFFEIFSTGLGNILLKNLDRPTAHSLLEGALGSELTREIGDVFFDQTGGNPRMLLELIRRLREMRLSSKKHFSKEWMKRLGHLHHFEDILLHRLTALDEGELQVLLALATAHDPVQFEDMEKVLEEKQAIPKKRGEDLSFRTLLERLISRELVLRDAMSGKIGMSLPGLEKVLVDSTAPETISEWHERWLTSLPNDDAHRAEQLHHALALGRQDLVTSMAFPVAETLFKEGQWLKALNLVARALELTQDPIQTSRLLRLKTNLLNELGRFEEALIACQDAFALGAQDEPLPLKTVKYHLVAGLTYQNLGRADPAAEHFRRCLAEGERYPGEETLVPYIVRAHTLLGRQQLAQQNQASAERHFQKALEMAGPRGRRRAEILRNLALLKGADKKWEEATSLLNQAKSLYAEDHFYQGEIASLLDEGNLAIESDQPQRAESSYIEGERLAREHEDEILLATLWNNLGVLERKRGHLSSALDYLSRALEIFRALGNLSDVAECLAQKAIAEAAVGRFHKATDDIQKLRALEDQSSSLKIFLDKAQVFLSEVQRGETGIIEGDLLAPDQLSIHWDKERALRSALRTSPLPDKALKEILQGIYDTLPVSLKVSFAERADFQRWIGKEKKRPPHNLSHKNYILFLIRITFKF